MLQPLADLERHATEQPDSIAIATPRRDYTFAQLREAVRAVAARLHEAGVSSDSLVAVDLPVALEWIVDLALFWLAAPSVSLRSVGGRIPFEPDVLLTEPGRRSVSSQVAIEIDHLWLDNTVAHAAEPPPPADFAGPESIFRLILTSGTTGTPRAAAYSVGAFEYRVAHQHEHWTDGRPELTTIGLSTTGGFHAAVACLRHGIAYLAIDRIDAESMLFAAKQHIRVLCGSPTQVAHALHVMTENVIAMPFLEEVRFAGAGPSTRLVELIERTFAVPVRGVYGSTEGGGISMLTIDATTDRFDVGRVLPDVELEIVDRDGTPVPAGVEGLVRYRTPGLVSGYLVDGAVEPFADGWFVPGDVGTLTADGSLVLGGRDSELLNIGGIKLDPVTIDELAADFAGVRDAAAFGVERRPGIAEVGLAVVADVGCDLRELDRQLREKLPIGHPTAFWRVAEIPRNRLGKANRGVLAEEFNRA